MSKKTRAAKHDWLSYLDMSKNSENIQAYIG
jgi:hypothetical protein